MGGVGQVMLLAFGGTATTAGGVRAARQKQHRGDDRDFWKLPKHNPRRTHHNR